MGSLTDVQRVLLTSAFALFVEKAFYISVIHISEVLGRNIRERCTLYVMIDNQEDTLRSNAQIRLKTEITVICSGKSVDSLDYACGCT